MIRILSSKRYWSLIGKIADLQETVKSQADTINKQQQSIEYVNEKLNNRNRQYFELKRMLAEKGICYVCDFPATYKIQDTSKGPECNINQILEH